MKTKFVTIFSLLLFVFACNSTETSDTQSDKKESSHSETSQKSEDKPLVVEDIKEQELPKEVKIKGKILAAKSWTDHKGDNILLVSQEANKFQLYAALFLNQGDAYSKVWLQTDGVSDCEFDATAEYVKEALSVTDLDKNGTAEVTTAYHIACRSDVSPAEVKVIMHEGEQKFGLRGVGILTMDKDKIAEYEKEYGMGKYDNEKDFTGAPAAFLDHAKKVWEVAKWEKIGEE